MSRQLNPAQIWSQAPLANRTSSTIRSQQIVSGTITVANNFTGSKDVTLTAVTDITKCIPIPGYLSGATLTFHPSSSYFTIVAAPVIFSTTVLRFTVTANAGNGDANLVYNVRVVEYY